MKNWIIAATAAIALAGALQAAPAAKKATGVRLSATLNGANEIGMPGTPKAGQRNAGDPDGTGSFAGRLNPGQGRLCYTLTVANVDTVTMAHIHTGAAGTNGGVFLPLAHANLGTEQCTTVTRAQAQALLNNPAGYYVNVHTSAFPPGAVRGQLAKR